VSTARSFLLMLAVVVGPFVLFHAVVFSVFRNVADLGPANENIDELRAVFLVLFAVLLASAVFAGSVAVHLTRAPWLTLLAAVPVIMALALFSFYLLEFLNACEVGRSLVVDSRC